MQMIMSRRAIFAAFLAMGISGTALADGPATNGLGQSWPNTTDVSANPNWHAYVFESGGVEYVQVNDLNGNVVGAIGTANGQFITLPIGRFSQLVSTPQQPAAAAPNATPVAAPTVVYQDSATQITVTPQSNGTLQLNAVSTSSTCDPIDCNIKRQ